VYYADTNPWAEELSAPKQPPEPVKEDRQTPVSEMLQQRERWQQERQEFLARVSATPPILQPSAMERHGGSGGGPAEGPAIGGRRFGDLFHRVMEGVPLSGGDRSLADRVAGAEAARAGLDEEAAELASRLAVEALENPDFREMLEGAERVREEVPFCVSLRELPVWQEDEGFLEGNIDLLLTGADGVTVLDYKTDRVEGTSLDELARGYWPQLALYAMAVQACGVAENRPRMALFFVRAGELRTRSLDDELIAEVQERGTALLEGPATDR
jgi:ATP-dependent exoDNAse (exonuclease V) beta subunit